MANFLTKLFGTKHERDTKKLQPLVDQPPDGADLLLGDAADLLVGEAVLELQSQHLALLVRQRGDRLHHS